MQPLHPKQQQKKKQKKRREGQEGQESEDERQAKAKAKGRTGADLHLWLALRVDTVCAQQREEMWHWKRKALKQEGVGCARTKQPKKRKWWDEHK